MDPRSGNDLPPAANRWKKRLDELDVRWRLLAEEPVSPEGVSAALRERVKELNCLYAISQLVDRGPRRLREFLAVVVDVLPPSWQYPEIACARIALGDSNYDSLHFEASPWYQSAPIHLQGAIAGEVTVYYTEPRPEAVEGPFLREERYLIDAVAERLGRIASRKLTESRLEATNHQLAVERTALREANAALRAVLGRIEIEKSEIRQDIQENVRKILTPIVRELAMIVPPEQRDYVAMLEENLEQIASPFVRRLSLAHQSLTATEIRICEMIRGGMGSKEIARLRGVSVATVNRHREHIRRKLGIANKKVNLVTHLHGIM